MDELLDPAGTTSRMLSSLIQLELNAPDLPQPLTLGDVLDTIHNGDYEQIAHTLTIDLDTEQSLKTELEELIENYGDDAPADQFVDYNASAGLTAVIDAVLESGTDQPATLGMVRAAIDNGLAASLVGSGDVDSDDNNQMLTEIDELILLHGEDTPAELFLT